MGFLTTVFMVRNSLFRDCVLIVQGKKGWVMFVMVPLAHNNILIGTARTMLNFAYTLCSSAMFVSDVLGVGYGVRAGFLCAVSLLCSASCASTGLSKHGDPV